jgi:hypothetical protein
MLTLFLALLLDLPFIFTLLLGIILDHHWRLRGFCSEILRPNGWLRRTLNSKI